MKRWQFCEYFIFGTYLLGERAFLKQTIITIFQIVVDIRIETEQLLALVLWKFTFLCNTIVFYSCILHSLNLITKFQGVLFFERMTEEVLDTIREGLKVIWPLNILRISKLMGLFLCCPFQKYLFSIWLTFSPLLYVLW